MTDQQSQAREVLAGDIARALAAKQIDSMTSQVGITISTSAREDLIERDYKGWLDEASYAADAAVAFAQAREQAAREAALEEAATLMSAWASIEDVARAVADEVSDKARCAVIAAEFRRSAAAIRTLAKEPRNG